VEAGPSPPEGRGGGSPPTPVTEPSASDEPSEDDSSSPGGAILLGLAAGALCFAAGLGSRRAWMRWRYGL
jgi:hypothetical protein